MPIPIEIDDNFQKSVEDFATKIQDIFKEDYSIDFSKRFVIAIKWIGRAIDEQDLDIKILYLSTALEAMLTSRSDRRKGETLAYRMLLLNSYLDKPFINPVRVLYVYELRSQIVHGGEVGIASKSDYYTMRRVVIDTLIKSIEFIRINGLKNYEEFIKALETPQHISQVLNWLQKQGDKLSIKIKKHMRSVVRAT
ncbi:MAG: HEPN domain-containing protein [Nitrososphaerota archaeon]